MDPLQTASKVPNTPPSPGPVTTELSPPSSNMAQHNFIRQHVMAVQAPLNQSDVASKVVSDVTGHVDGVNIEMDHDHHVGGEELSRLDHHRSKSQPHLNLEIDR